MARTDYYFESPKPKPEPAPAPAPLNTPAQALASTGIDVRSGGKNFGQIARDNPTSILGSGGKEALEIFDINMNMDYSWDNVSGVKGDKVGMFKDLPTAAQNLGSAGLLFSDTAMSGLGVLGLIAGAKGGIKNPITGESTAQIIPFLDNLALKEKYDAMQNIQTYVSETKNVDGLTPLGYDIFKIGPHTFVRGPGEFRFTGNVGALGIDHMDLHKIIAVKEEKDPSTYDYKTKTGDKILTYGNGIAGGYRLDGYHVDNMGRLASAATGQSDEFVEVANKYFNGDVGIAREWLASTAQFRNKGNFFTLNPQNQYSQEIKDQMMANFVSFQAKAGLNLDDSFSDLTSGTAQGSIGTDMYNTADDDVNRSDFTGTDMFNTADDDINRSDIVNYNNMRMYRPTTSPKIGVNQVGFNNAGVTTASFNSSNMIDITDDLITNKTVLDVAGDLDFDHKQFMLNRTNRNTNTRSSSSSVFNQLSQKPLNIGQALRSSAVDDSQKDQIISQQVAAAQNFDRDEDLGTENRGTPIGSDFQKIDDFTGNETDETGFGGDFAFQEGGFVDPTVDVFNNPDRYGLQEGGQPQLVGGVMPQNIPESETVADDVPAKLKPNSFVVNGAATEEIILNPESINVAGVQDIRKMILDAYSFSRERGMQTGQVDRGLYEKSVDVALSKGELVIPPDLVKIIGKDRLTKINNRGKREVRRRAKAAQ